MSTAQPVIFLLNFQWKDCLQNIFYYITSFLPCVVLKLKLQYFGHLMRRTDSFEKTLMLGKIEGRKRRVRQRMRWLDGITDSMDVSLSELREWWWTWRPGVLQFMVSERVWHDWATELNFVYVWIYTVEKSITDICIITTITNVDWK